MALDGLILHNIIASLQLLCPLRINKIAQISQKEIVLSCYNQQRFELLISTDSESNRLLVTNTPYRRVDEPNHFIMLLRKYCENGTIQTIEQTGLDRIVTLTITNRNELGDTIKTQIVVELMGKYANIILVDETQHILDAFHRIAPFENTQRTIFSGAKFVQAPSQNKKDPRFVQDIDGNVSLTSQFEGFSPLFSKEVEYRLKQGEKFSEIIHQVLTSKHLYRYQKHFHALELKHLEAKAEVLPLMEGLDIVYQQQVTQARIKQHTGNLFKIVHRELKRSKNKRVKLADQLIEAQDNQHLQQIGEILLTYGQDLPKGHQQVTLQDFDNQLITIELDERLDGLENAHRYFTRYRKQKNAQQHLQEQIQKTEYDIQYFENLQYQLQQANIEDAQEIRQELVNHHIIREKRKKSIHRKQEKTQYTGYLFNETTLIYGRNNKQNEYITFKMGQKNHYWFHVQNAPGAHVLVMTSQMDEALIRFAANVAAYHSSFQQASSVAVDYTTIDQIKKIPQAPRGLVSLQSYKTIFIDPENPLSIDGATPYHIQK